MCHWWQWQIAFLLEHPEAISVMAFCMPSIIFPLIQNLTAFLFSFLWLLIVLLQRNVCPVKSYLMESDRKVKPTVTNYAIKPQKATRWQTSQISEGTGAVLLFHYPLTSPTYAGAYFSISRSPSVCLIMHDSPRAQSFLSCFPFSYVQMHLMSSLEVWGYSVCVLYVHISATVILVVPLQLLIAALKQGPWGQTL